MSTPLGIVEPVALAVGFEDVPAVSEPVEGSAGQPFAAEYLHPAFEWLVVTSMLVRS